MTCALCGGERGGAQGELEFQQKPAGTLRDVIRALLKRAGPEGLTADEIQKATGRSQASVSGRLSTMRKRHEVNDTGLQRCTRLGALARAFVLAPEPEGLAR